jgi:hypothetical protein
MKAAVISIFAGLKSEAPLSKLYRIRAAAMRESRRRIPRTGIREPDLRDQGGVARRRLFR